MKQALFDKFLKKTKALISTPRIQLINATEYIHLVRLVRRSCLTMRWIYA